MHNLFPADWNRRIFLSKCNLHSQTHLHAQSPKNAVNMITQINQKKALTCRLCLESPFQVPQWGDPCRSPSHPPTDPQGKCSHSVFGPSTQIMQSSWHVLQQQGLKSLALKVKQCIASKQDTSCAELISSCSSALGMFCRKQAL